MSVIVEFVARSAYFDVFARSIKLTIARLHAFTTAEMANPSVDIPDSLETASEISETNDLDRGLGKAIENGQVETQAVAAEQNAVLKFFGGVLTAAKEKMLGDTWWLASDTTDIVEIPAKYLAANHIELERKDEFILLKGNYTGSVIYHVTVVWKKDGKMYSIWRHELLAATKDFVRSVAPFAILLKYIDNVKDIKTLLTHIGKHPLWKPVHIAARMDLQSFFQDAHMNGTLPVLLKQACHPEGRYPIHLVVFYNFVELTKKLFSYGASVAQTDAKGWTALHYGARSSPAMLEVLCSHPQAKQCMNALSSDGYTPLFLAITGCRPTCIAALMNRGAVANISCQGRSALHEAMLQNNAKVQDVIQTLVQACPASVTEIDPVTGNSLLHTANNKKSLAALMAVAPTMDKNVKNKVGQTALHWHVQKDDLGMVVTLITYGIDLDAKDHDGNTALHIAVSRGNLDIVKALLVLGCNVNERNITGDSPFHMAVRLKHKDKFDIIRCLIICGAQQCPQDKQGCTVQCAYRPPGLPPRPPPPYSTLTDVVPSYIDTKTPADIAHTIVPSISEPSLIKREEGAKISSPKKEYSVRTGAGVFASTTAALTHLDQFMQQKCVENIERQCKEVDDDEEKPKFETVLTLDGGGIRGLVLVQTLLALERALGGEPILKYIDWMAGTSTGAFLTAALVKGKTLRDAQHMYLQFKDDIFEGWVRPYSAETLEKFLTILAGPQTTMADIKEPKVLITTTAADKIPIRLHLFRNYRLPMNDEENIALGYLDPEEQVLWKALRCSSAAPTYFTSVENKFVDGGLAANNPTVEVLTEIQRYNNALEYSGKSDEKLRVGCVISVGTGLMPDIPAESLNFGGVESMSAIRTLGLMLIEQACATEGGPVERARAWLQQMGAPLYRLNPLLSKDYMLDTKDDKEIVSMMWEAEEYAREKAEQFKELATFLKVIKE